jgi:hypothetical protein
MIREDRQITVYEVDAHLDISYGSAYVEKLYVKLLTVTSIRAVKCF